MGRAPTIESLKVFCRSLRATTEDIKWGDNLIFSVGGKMYAGFDEDGGDQYAFKCDDDDFERLTKVAGIIPAPYAARFGWVKVRDRAALTGDEARALLRKAHGLIVACLPARTRRALGAEDSVAGDATPGPRRTPPAPRTTRASTSPSARRASPRRKPRRG